ncbi:hypothetical protein OG2516_02903 [Oceanicola granulosus HTCC2516]|uniref:NADH dehydrogenase subunit E n=1 Tax=Oceanicola granulosus (strain ATCC BAA-861 / DSM 15982 / KCTC 12143 / HTCC2516) TaxID=314256 RepID=Q2CA11_OCEGH|nr:DUF5333 domain-containing protein [Oceanicola granulosus]EAR49499.1 hypothetical protein OG2516_02903 [Oceanicola granulosus HTCC2516]
MTRALLLLALPIGIAALSAGPSRADNPIGQVPAIREGLIATGIAVEISDKCDDLQPRVLRGLAYLESLRAHARELGYSNDEIDSFVDDKAEKNRLEAEARARLASMGAVEGQGETYCAVGRGEINRDSAIGRLLRKARVAR